MLYILLHAARPAYIKPRTPLLIPKTSPDPYQLQRQYPSLDPT